MKRSTKTTDGTAPLYLRVTMNSERAEISCKRSVIISKWNTAAQRMIGSNDDAKFINSYIKTLERQVYDAYQMMVDKKMPLSASNLKKILTTDTDEADKTKMLVPIFKEHNKQVKALIGKEYVEATYIRLKRA